MKRGTPEHFKTVRLMTLLSVERPCDRSEAIGILETLCNHYAPRSAPQGNIGRCSNTEIAIGVHSTRDPNLLVCALVESGWLDEHAEHRLLIHDWKDHADESVKKFLARNKLPFITASGSRRSGVATPSRRRRDAVDPPRAGNGGGEGDGTGSDLFPDSGKGGVGGNAFDRFWLAYPRKVKKDKARESWRGLLPTAELADRIIAAVVTQRTWDQWTRDRGRYIPYPATWLNNRGWEDEGVSPEVALAEVVLGKNGVVEREAGRRFLARGAVGG